VDAKVYELEKDNTHASEFQNLISQFQAQKNEEAKEKDSALVRKMYEDEAKIRGNTQDDHYRQKKDLENEIHDMREQVLSKMDNDQNAGMVKLLLERAKFENSDKLLALAEEKERDMKKIKAQISAKNKNDLKQLEEKIEEEMKAEKKEEDEKFNKKKKELIKELKENYVAGLSDRE